MANAYGMASKLSPKYDCDKLNREGRVASFVRDVILGGLSFIYTLSHCWSTSWFWPTQEVEEESSESKEKELSYTHCLIAL